LIALVLKDNPFYTSGRREFKLGKTGLPRDNLVCLGRTRNKNFQTDLREPSDLAVAKLELPQLAQYKLPSQSPIDEIHALRSLMSAMRDESEEGLEYLHIANVVLVSATPRSPYPAWFDQRLSTDDVVAAIMNLDRTKHPGYPANLLGPTKGDVIDNYLPFLVQAVIARIIMLELVASRCKTPMQLYVAFCADFCGVSIKSEVIKIDKLGRIIVSNSMVQSVVEALLYDPFNETFKNACFETYSAIGVGFSKSDSELLHLTWPKRKASSDVPTFDGTKTPEESALTAVAVCASYGLRTEGRHARIRRMIGGLEWAYCNKIFVLSDGTLFAQTKPGTMASGRNQTSNFNTMDRSRRSYAVSLYIQMIEGDCDPSNTSAGDDNVEGDHESRESVYQHLGFPLRDYEASDNPSFCSHDWPVGMTPVGRRIYKSAFKILCNRIVTEEQTVAFCREYGAHPDFPAVFDVVSSHRPEMIYQLIDRQTFET
jgi:hypothetical protein